VAVSAAPPAEPPKPPTADYKRGFGWTLLFNVLTKLTTPIIGVVVARQLGPEVMGMYVVLVTLMAFADLFRDAGISRVYLNDPEVDAARERGYAAIACVVAAVLGGLLAALSVPLSRLFMAPQLAAGLLFGAFAILLNGFSTLPQAKLLREGRFKEAAFAESAASVLSSVWALALVLSGYGFWALASQLVVRSVIFLGATWRLAPVGCLRGERGLLRRIAGVSGALTGVNVLWVGFSMGDQAIAGKMLGLAAGGLYGTGKMIVTTADVVARPLTQMVTVAFAHRVTDPASVGRTLHKSLRVFLVAIVPIYVAVAMLAEPIVLVLLGERFAGTAPLLPALCLYGAATYVGSFAGSALLVAGRPQIALYGWIALYGLLGGILALHWQSLDLVRFAWLLACALLAVNLVTLSFALRHYPPGRESLVRAARGAGAVLITSAATVAIALSGMSQPLTLLGSFVLLPVIHLFSMGTLFAAKHSRFLSTGGFRQLWESL
jgi:O-antigen/teichoic acid export membrane protein